MDLRKRLVWALGMLLGGLVAMTMLVNLYSLRQDVEAEIRASEQLLAVLLQASRIPAPARDELTALLENAALRHLTIQAAEDASPPAEQLGWLSRWLGISSPENAGQTMKIGEHTLRITSNPASEIDERFDDTVRLCITLLFFSGATLLVAWWSAHRALAPVRELEAGLQRLAGGEVDAALPGFALREFTRVAEAIDTLAGALADSRHAQHQLAQLLITVQEEERQSLARELHDEMGQTLTAIGVTAAFIERNASQLDPVRVAECAADLRRDLRNGNIQLKNMLKQLRPHGLDATELTYVLRELVSSWQQRAATIDFQLSMPVQLPGLSEKVCLIAYRVTQEALTNVVRHSDARNCWINVDISDEGLHLNIRDNGKGLPDSVPPRMGSGLLGMTERLEMIGGRLSITGAAGQGLQVDASLPLEKTEKKETQHDSHHSG